ncbi:hypothetical protein OTU49_010739 [Cherax quadricarinatus]|uniref:Uncharacterized protein n=1 Tax=Cherax quadricarinatus TaxID=27406 RepID=A0AAW0WD02_CHEQU|nr:WAS/WASL-interacting protein family member 3-like [Cherax quadricarinatus]
MIDRTLLLFLVWVALVLVLLSLCYSIYFIVSYCALSQAGSYLECTGDSWPYFSSLAVLTATGIVVLILAVAVSYNSRAGNSGMLHTNHYANSYVGQPGVEYPLPPPPPPAYMEHPPLPPGFVEYRPPPADVLEVDRVDAERRMSKIIIPRAHVNPPASSAHPTVPPINPTVPPINPTVPLINPAASPDNQRKY